MTPRQRGWTLAPAWNRPGRFWMGWPAGSGDRERDTLAREDALGLAELLSDHAPVTILAHPEDVAECALRTPSGVSALAARHDGRPVGRVAPRWLLDGDGAVVAALAADDDLSRLMAEASQVSLVAPPSGLDLSAMDCDGGGIALATDRLADCLGDHAWAEAMLSDWLGLGRVIWLDEAEGRLPARFLAPGLVAMPMAGDPSQPGHAAVAANRARVLAEGLNVVDLPNPRRAGGCYADCLVAGGLVVVPSFEDRLDDDAFARLTGALPDRRLFDYPALRLGPGTGGLGMAVAVSPA